MKKEKYYCDNCGKEVVKDRSKDVTENVYIPNSSIASHEDNSWYGIICQTCAENTPHAVLMRTIATTYAFQTQQTLPTSFKVFLVYPQLKEEK